MEAASHGGRGGWGPGICGLQDRPGPVDLETRHGEEPLRFSAFRGLQKHVDENIRKKPFFRFLLDPWERCEDALFFEISGARFIGRKEGRSCSRLGRAGGTLSKGTRRLL